MTEPMHLTGSLRVPQINYFSIGRVRPPVKNYEKIIS